MNDLALAAVVRTDPGVAVPCPKPAARCASHTPYRFHWSPDQIALPGTEGGPRVAVIMQNPTCPDDAVKNMTFRNVAWLMGPDQLGASTVTMLNVLPIRTTSAVFQRLTLDDLDRYALADNIAIIADEAAGADLVIAAWGTGHRVLRVAVRRIYEDQVQQIARVLRGVSLVQQVGTVFHPVVWRRHPRGLRAGGATASHRNLRAWN